MHVLEDEETGDEARRQRRLSVSRRADLIEAPVEETPVDLPRQPHQRMAHVDDRFQGRPEQVRLPIVARFRHLDPPLAESTRESNQKTPKCGIPNRRKRGRATNLSCKKR